MITLKKRFEDLDSFVINKRVILRVDLNLPSFEGEIVDFTRLEKISPTIKYLLKRKAKIILVSHLGRPKGTKNNQLSLTPIYKFLKEQLETNVYFFMGDINEETKSKFAYLKEGEIILLENIRFFKEESENDDNFAKKLASLGDIYINDAFACSHRKQSSIHKITKFVSKKYAGPLMKREIDSINFIINR